MWFLKIKVLLIMSSCAWADLMFDADGNLLDDGLAELLSRPQNVAVPKIEASPEADKVLQKAEPSQFHNHVPAQVKLSKDLPLVQPHHLLLDAVHMDPMTPTKTGATAVHPAVITTTGQNGTTLPASALHQSPPSVSKLTSKSPKDTMLTHEESTHTTLNQKALTHATLTNKTQTQETMPHDTPKGDTVQNTIPTKKILTDDTIKDEEEVTPTHNAPKGEIVTNTTPTMKILTGDSSTEEDIPSTTHEGKTVGHESKKMVHKFRLNLAQQLPSKTKTRKIKVKNFRRKNDETAETISTSPKFITSRQTNETGEESEPVMDATILEKSPQLKPVDSEGKDPAPIMDATILDGNFNNKPIANQRDHLGNGNEANKSSEQLTYYPWESLLCEDADPEGCALFKPFCKIMEVVAYRKCRKSCKLCKEDKPKNKVLVAEFPVLNAHLTLTQNCPTAPVFLTACFSKAMSESLKKTVRTYSMIIHSYGEIANSGATCQNFGPHFNPHGTSHGDPEDPSKHAGDLGILDFGSVPDDWPKGVDKCNSTEIGAYSMLDHLTLFGDLSPLRLPVVMYNGNPPYMEFSSKDAITCGRLLDKPRLHVEFNLVSGIATPERSVAEPMSAEVNPELVRMVAEKIGSPKLIAERAVAEKMKLENLSSDDRHQSTMVQ